MSAREWKPGDVAVVEVGCWANRHVGIFDGGGWRYGDNKWAANDPAIITARPLVVIDPESAEQVERLSRAYMAAIADNMPADHLTHLQAALREFVDPKPPEPTGLGAVVEDAEHRKWVRCDNTPGSFPWVRPGHGVAGWSEIDAVRVLSEGVTS